jgi:hypothetical protein
LTFLSYLLLAARQAAERYRNHHEAEVEELDPRQLLLRGMPRMKPITPQLQHELQGIFLLFFLLYPPRAYKKYLFGEELLF